MVLAINGCALQRAAPVPTVFDFGPGTLQAPASVPHANLPPLEITTPQTSPALNTTAVLYRLAYADTQQLKPYALARWSMPPALLMSQRLRAQLGLHRAVVSSGDITPAAAPRRTASMPEPTDLPNKQLETLHHLRIELEEFSQLFDAPDASSGVLRLRATLSQRSASGETLLAQRSFVAQGHAPTADASGGVRALTAATDQVVQDIDAWLTQVERAGGPQ